MTFKAPVLRYTDVGDYAQKFLQDFHPDFKLPVPIEGIIEFDLGIHIVPFQYMWRIFKQSAWLSADRTTIFVDEYQQDNYWEKYRFTLAHEVGHFFMHEGVYDGPDFKSVEEQIKYFRSRDKHEINWCEKQGDWFAGHVLVPSQLLEPFCAELVDPYRERFGHDDLSIEGFKMFAASELAERFQVNPMVVEIRIDREDLARRLFSVP